MLEGPALASRYLSIFNGVKAKGSSNAIRILRHKNKGKEVSKKRRKGKKAKGKNFANGYNLHFCLKNCILSPA